MGNAIFMACAYKLPFAGVSHGLQLQSLWLIPTAAVG